MIVENICGEAWFGGEKICLALDNWSLKLRPFPKDAEMWLEDVEEPDSSMDAAAEVVEAMAVAETGSGWLWLPS